MVRSHDAVLRFSALARIARRTSWWLNACYLFRVFGGCFQGFSCRKVTTKSIILPLSQSNLKSYDKQKSFHCSNSRSFSLACHILTQGSHLPVAGLSALYTECLLHPLARLVRSSVLKSLLSIETISAQNMAKKDRQKPVRV